MTETETIYMLDLAALRTDGGTQSRQGINQETVSDYARALAEGDQFPPVQVMHDGEHYWLVDGYHRLAAHQQAGRESIPALVEPGTMQDAQWASFAANRTNALQRTTADKQQAVQGALRHPLGAARSDGDIARHVGVDRQTVTNWRKKLEASGEIRQSATRTGADGRTYSTAKVSKVKQEEPATDEAPVPAEEIAALPVEPVKPVPPAPAPKPTPAKPEQPPQLPPRMDIAPPPAENGTRPGEVQQVMLLRIFERAAELASAELAVVPPYTIRAELVEEQARQVLNSPAVKMAASMLSLSATEKTEF